MTCLMWAAYNNSPEVIKVLLDQGAEVEEKDVDGLTALHWWVVEADALFGPKFVRKSGDGS